MKRSFLQLACVAAIGALATSVYAQTQYGSPAAALAFPRVIELWQEGKLAARFEALEAGSRRAGPSGEEEDRD